MEQLFRSGSKVSAMLGRTLIQSGTYYTALLKTSFNSNYYIVWKVKIQNFFLVCVFLYSNTLNTGKYGPEKTPYLDTFWTQYYFSPFLWCFRNFHDSTDFWNFKFWYPLVFLNFVRDSLDILCKFETNAYQISDYKLCNRKWMDYWQW